MVFAACDKDRYEQLGVEGVNESCADNLKAELRNAVLVSESSLGKHKDISTAIRSKSTMSATMLEAIRSADRAVQRWTPDPVNLFMNVPVKALEGGKGGELGLEKPVCPKGGYVVLRAEVECAVVMSACPVSSP